MRALHQGAVAVVGAGAGAGAGAGVRGGTGGVCVFFFQWHSTLKGVFFSHHKVIAVCFMQQIIGTICFKVKVKVEVEVEV
jgi:hypothetical protein